MATARNALNKFVAGVSTNADMLSYPNLNADIIDAAIAKSNWVAATDPGVGDDSADGYVVGSWWWNTTGHRLWQCESASAGAAVWRQLWPSLVTDMSQVGALAKCNVAASTNPGVGDDSADGYAVNSTWHNTTAHKIFICEDASAGAAVWRQIWPDLTSRASVVVTKRNGLITAYKNTGEVLASGTEDTADFTVCQAAFDALTASDFSIEFFGNIFYVDAPVLLPDKLDMDGHGATFQMEFGASAFNAIFQDENPANVKTRIWRMRNIELEGADKTTVDYGLDVSRVQYCCFENVYAGNFAKDGFIVRDDSWGNTWLNCYTWNNAENGIHFIAGTNDKPNCNLLMGGRYAADDVCSIFIEDGTDVKVMGADINSSVTGILAYDNSLTVDNCYLEALTNGIVLGEASHNIQDVNIRNCAMYTVTNKIVFTNVDVGTVQLSGNRHDGVSIDRLIGTGMGTGSDQEITVSGLVGTVARFACWYTASPGTNAVPAAYTDVWDGNHIHVLADNGRSYTYLLEMGY